MILFWIRVLRRVRVRELRRVRVRELRRVLVRELSSVSGSVSVRARARISQWLDWGIFSELYVILSIAPSIVI